MSEVAALQEQLEGNKTLVEMRDAIERLALNRDFRKVILDGFCRNETARYVQEAGDPLLDQRQRDDALAMAMASGHLKRFLNITVVMGNGAEAQLRNIEAAIDDARAEEGDE